MRRLLKVLKNDIPNLYFQYFLSLYLYSKLLTSPKYGPELNRKKLNNVNSLTKFEQRIFLVLYHMKLYKNLFFSQDSNRQKMMILIYIFNTYITKIEKSRSEAREQTKEKTS